MVAVSVDYRIGYLHHSTPFESFEDAKDAICWLRSHASDYQLDPDKIAVAGGSAGGHLAAALGDKGFCGTGAPIQVIISYWLTMGDNNIASLFDILISPCVIQAKMVYPATDR